MGRELLAVIEQIGREKGIDTGRILDAVESALLTAAKKKYGAAENIQVRIDRKSGEVEAISLKKIVNEVTNPKSEVSLEEARRVDTEAELGDEIGSVIEIEDFGRIAAQTAKQVIFQKVREAEWEVVQREYSARQGDLVNGIILGQERRSEEHTSELQSLAYLVCRLLLEKKKRVVRHTKARTKQVTNQLTENI